MTHPLHLLIAVLVFALVYYVIERYLIPMIADSFIRQILRIIVIVVAIIYLLNLLFAPNPFYV